MDTLQKQSTHVPDVNTEFVLEAHGVVINHTPVQQAWAAQVMSTDITSAISA